MNKELRFSAGHIAAFLALIFIAYVTFMGITYCTLGDFLIAGLGSAICVILLAVVLLGAQIKKGESNRTKFYKSLIWERWLLVASPLVLALAFYPYNHFWTVLSLDEEISKDFNSSITQAHGIFDEYEEYAQNRIDKLSNSLENVKNINVDNRIDELKLVLLSSNYNELKKEANSWIDNSSSSINVFGLFSVSKSSVWNVFLFGNLDNISDAISKWSGDLSEMSSKQLKIESYEIESFSSNCQSKQLSIKGLNDLKDKYSNIGYKFNWISVFTMVICLIMLLCPYFIQERNAANDEKFWDFWPFSSKYNADNIHETVLEPQEHIQSDKGKLNENITTEIKKTNNKPKSSKGAPV